MADNLPSYLGCILSGENRATFPAIRRELRARGVVFGELKLLGARSVFWLHRSEAELLPHHEGDPYLPVGPDEGHSIYGVDDILRTGQAVRRP